MSDQTSSRDTTALWAAVHRLTRPSRVKIDRQMTPHNVVPDLDYLGDLAAQTEGACLVSSYRSASVVWATIPSLWDQSTAALYGSGGEEGRGSKPLRERSVADLNLLEIRHQITERTRSENEERGEKLPRKNGRLPDFKPTEVERLASLIVAKSPDRIDEFAYIIAQWGRVIETYLNAADHEVRDVYLRNSPCPTCGTKQVTKLVDGAERIVVPALQVKFNQGLVHYAYCQACGDGWLRGEALEGLAEKLGVQFPGSEKMPA